MYKRQGKFNACILVGVAEAIVLKAAGLLELFVLVNSEIVSPVVASAKIAESKLSLAET